MTSPTKNGAARLSGLPGSGVEAVIDLFDYIDPDLYVHDMREAMSVSYGELSNCTGKSTSYLHRLCNGKAHLTEDMVKGVASCFELSKVEASYLKQLIQYKKADSVESRKRRLGGLLKSRMAREKWSNEQGVAGEEEALLRQILSWEHVVLLTLAQQVHVRDDEYTLSVLFGHRVDSRKFRAVIDQMLRLGVLEREPNGYLFAPNKDHVNIGSSVHHREALKMFYYDVLHHAADAVLSVPRDQRSYLCTTVAMDEVQYAKYKAYITQKWEEEIGIAAREFAKQSSGTRKKIVQVGGFLFPWSQNEDEIMPDE